MKDSRANDINIELSPELISCKELWLSVINQALIDAMSNCNLSRAQNNKLRAINWLVNENENFENICQLAGLNYFKIRKKIIAVLATDKKARKAIITLIKTPKSKVKMTLDLRPLFYEQYRVKPSPKIFNNINRISSRYYLRHNYTALKQLLLD